MARSRGQLGSAYAPGAFFTFEGGLAACISIPDLSASVDDAPITAPTKAQIILRLQEIWQTRFSRAYSVGSPTRPIDPEQCLDEALLKGASVVPLGFVEVTAEHFGLERLTARGGNQPWVKA